MKYEQWRPSSWSMEHPRFGYFFIDVRESGDASAYRVQRSIVHTIGVHDSLGAAILACQSHIAELEAVPLKVAL